jgi:hypothetical protein
MVLLYREQQKLKSMGYARQSCRLPPDQEHFGGRLFGPFAAQMFASASLPSQSRGRGNDEHSFISLGGPDSSRRRK